MREYENSYNFPPMPPAPFEEMPPQPSGITRPEFLWKGSLALAGTLYGLGKTNAIVDKVVEQDRWPDDPRGLQIETLRYDKVPGSRTEGCLAGPGFGGNNGLVIARFLQQHADLSSVTPIASVIYPNQGYENSEVAELMEEYVQVNELQSLSLIGLSMGGPQLLRGARDLSVPLRRINLITAPENIGNARDGIYARLVAELGLGHTLGEKYVANVVDDIRYNGLQDDTPKGIIDVFKKAYAQTMSGASPRLLGKQLHNLNGFNFIDDWKSYKHVIIPGFTEVLFCSPNDLSSDKTVNNTEALRDWTKFFSLFGIKVAHQGVSEPGHAQVGSSILASGAWFRKTNPHNQQLSK
jgi:hypothetical protein